MRRIIQRQFAYISSPAYDIYTSILIYWKIISRIFDSRCIENYCVELFRPQIFTTIFKLLDDTLGVSGSTRDHTTTLI